MAQGIRFTCDGGCGEECGTSDNPVIYVVVGSRNNGQLEADVKLPAFVWSILKRAVPRQDFCPKCFGKALGLPLMTVDEHDKATAAAAAPVGDQ